MQNSSLDWRLRSQLLTRRAVVLSSLALASGVVAAQLPGARTRAASGQLPGASLGELASYTDWRRTWHLIVPLLAEREFPRTLLLYDREAGEAALQSVDQVGGVREVGSYPGWRASWDIMVPSRFPDSPGVTGVFAYDRAAGHVTTLQFDAAGNFEQLQDLPHWRKTWTSFVPFGASGLLGYERGSGYATLFAMDRSGRPREIRSYNDWRPTWDLVTSGPFTVTSSPVRDILLYDRAARLAEGHTIAANGDMSLIGTYSGWRPTWSALAGGQFQFAGFDGSMTADLVLFDRDTQEVEFLDLAPGSVLTSILLTSTPDEYSWTDVAPIGPDLLLFYDRALGAAGFYVTDRAPDAAPTPTPTPTPGPETIDTGSETIRLQQGEGHLWDTYTGQTGDPASGGSQDAHVTGVKNTANKRIGVIHRDRSGKRIGPEYIKASEVSDRFNGMLVAGDWEATISGSESEAPARIAIEVRYEVR